MLVLIESTMKTVLDRRLLDSERYLIVIYGLSILHLCLGTRGAFFDDAARQSRRQLYGWRLFEQECREAHFESPVFDPDSGTLYWVDVLNKKIHKLDYYTKEHSVKVIGYGEVNFVMPVAFSSRLVVGCRSQIFLLDWSRPGDSALRPVAFLDALQPDNVVNEAKADAMGRLWAGTKGPHQRDAVLPDRGALYRLEAPRFRPEPQLKPVSISNGLAWSLNNSVLYYTDSATNRIDAFDFDLCEGSISRRRTVVDLFEHGFQDAIPDGMTIDRDGCLWVALLRAAKVIRIDPDKRTMMAEYRVPRATSVTFAGRNLEVLIVTTSSRNLDPHNSTRTYTGSVYAFEGHGTGGVPNHKFVYPNADKY